MCQSANFPEDDFYTGQVQQLADHLGVHPAHLIWHERDPFMFNNGYAFCLCPIDLEATGEKFGYACEHDECGNVTFRRIRDADEGGGKSGS